MSQLSWWCKVCNRSMHRGADSHTKQAISSPPIPVAATELKEKISSASPTGLSMQEYLITEKADGYHVLIVSAVDGSLYMFMPSRPLMDPRWLPYKHAGVDALTRTVSNPLRFAKVILQFQMSLLNPNKQKQKIMTITRQKKPRKPSWHLPGRRYNINNILAG
eukprot:g1406.t1